MIFLLMILSYMDVTIRNKKHCNFWNFFQLLYAIGKILLILPTHRRQTNEKEKKRKTKKERKYTDNNLNYKHDMVILIQMLLRKLQPQRIGKTEIPPRNISDTSTSLTMFKRCVCSIVVRKHTFMRNPLIHNRFVRSVHVCL